MKLTVFRRTFTITFWKVLLWLFLAALLVGTGAFIFRINFYYQAIKRGDTNPLLERQLQSSVSRLIANTAVTTQDLQRLVNESAPSIGADMPELTIVEFIDYGCPFTRASFAAVRKIVMQNKARVRWIVRDFPIEELHPRAMQMALAARCAQAQGKFWEYNSLLFTEQNVQPQDLDLERYATQASLDVAAYRTCISDSQSLSNVEQDLRDGLQAGVNGTPTFFFNGVKIQGGVDEDVMRYLIKTFLERDAQKK